MNTERFYGSVWHIVLDVIGDEFDGDRLTFLLIGHSSLFSGRDGFDFRPFEKSKTKNDDMPLVVVEFVFDMFSI
ncbi:protein of unknown function [Pseudodesulfovibrio profundus]|uniref:Uncharacterized protein n=1 Tax=Pseudodesulfovibrio profundus TaxID=57320 RepID=A0A2C8F4V8_9BACT|nr:protein of unknown function [Pseudodesulfovibrio profundus]